jgi:hypothetical protein
MKKDNINFKFVIGNLSNNDPFTRVMLMKGNEVIETIYKTELNDILLAQMECLKALSNYANKKAEEYQKIIDIKE